MPAFVNCLDLDCPSGYRPRSNDAAPDSENTLWKYGSKFGKSIVDPRVTATTRGANDSSCWRIWARETGSDPPKATPFRYSTTLRISGAVGVAWWVTPRGAYALVEMGTPRM